MNDPRHAVSVARTLRLKVKPEAAAWLNAAASEVNAVWNWANEVNAKAARPFASRPKWLSGFELNNLSAGGTEYFEKIGADTIQRVNGEYALRRRAAGRCRLRWRVSRGARRSLGWVPFKAARSLTGPQGVNGLRVRRWRCANCGESHDRDVNAARNLLRRAEVSASVCGNGSPSLSVPPRRASRSREAGIQAPRAAA